MCVCVCVRACVSVFGVFVCTGCCVWQWLMVVCWWLQWRGDTIKLFSFILSHTQSLTHILSPGPRRAPVGPPHPLMPHGNGAPGRSIDPLSARTPHQSLTRCISLYLPLSCPCTPSFVSLIFFVSFCALNTYSFTLAAAGKDSNTKPNLHSSLWVEMGVKEDLIILIPDPPNKYSYLGIKAFFESLIPVL